MGTRDLERRVHVTVATEVFPPRPLDPRFDLRNHSPTGFEWGYGGSGPAQLALAILADLYKEEVALELYQAFKFAVVGRLPRDGWTLTSDEVDAFVRDRQVPADLERADRFLSSEDVPRDPEPDGGR